ncbi:MAG: metallophosphoesterase [Oscillospiraceae bacterium]|nr:metallophosphoesterase [Oscillospiraceae bacterium]
MINEFLKTSEKHVKHRVWLMSDLQQHDPDRSRRCFYTAVEDFERLGLKCEKVWYMGDSVEGEDLNKLNEMTKMQEEVFLRLGLPVNYCPGNHDMDYLAASGRAELPFRAMVASHKADGWKTTEKLSDFYFWDKLGDIDVLFLCDCAAEDGSWRFCHGSPFGEGYPYTYEDFRRVAEERDSKAKVITAGHYSYPGGNRATEYMGGFMPISDNVKLHIYGHAHIGDSVWAGKDWGRQISGTDNHMLTQVNISSLETGRGNAIRSAFLEIYDRGMAVFFRNHSKKCWDKMLVLND